MHRSYRKASSVKRVDPAVKLGVPDCIADCVRLAVPQATVWQRIGDEIDAAIIPARADFVNVLGTHSGNLRRTVGRSET